MNYNHLTIEERGIIAFLHRNNFSIREIAKTIQRNPSTISRELKRNYHKITCEGAINKDYTPALAHKMYKSRIHKAHEVLFYNDIVFEIIEMRLKETWSPEQISGYYRQRFSEFPSFKSIYSWINKRLLVNGNKRYLRRKGTHGKWMKRTKFSGKTIEERNPLIECRDEFGHWEADSVMPKHGKHKDCFITLAERKTRKYLVKKVKNHSKEAAAEAITQLLSGYPSSAVKTITCDRGTEFADWRTIESSLNCLVYFANPGCPWQKGTNENSNGLLREFYPKKTSFCFVKQSKLDKNVELINNRPRKCNNWISSNEMFKNELSVALAR